MIVVIFCIDYQTLRHLNSIERDIIKKRERGVIYSQKYDSQTLICGMKLYILLILLIKIRNRELIFHLILR